MRFRKSAFIGAICGFLALASAAHGARAFNGSSQYLNAGAAVGITAPPFTVAVWFNVANTTAAHTLWYSGIPSGQGRFALQLRGDVGGDPIRAIAVNSGGTAGQASTSAGYSASTWQHACGVWTSTSSRTAYLNGANSGTDSTSITAGTPTDTYLGAQSISSTVQTYCNGSVAEVAVWSVALTSGEITALAAGYNPLAIRPQSLVSYSPLIADLRDYKRGASWTDHNTSTVATHCRRIGFLVPRRPRSLAWIGIDWFNR